MTAGALPGISPAEPRKRGRPKGSTGKRAKDFAGFVNATFGGSAAQQSARFCMVTPAELRLAGSMAQAQVNKALDLVRKTRDAQATLHGDLQAVVVEALEDLIAKRTYAEAAELRAFVGTFLGKVKAASGELTLSQALKLLADARADLLPYTDKKQPVAVEIDGGAGPSVVIMAADPVSFHQVGGGDVTDADFIDVLPTYRGQDTGSKTRADQQTLALAGLEADPPTD